jgi:hypothetical protein
MMGEGEMQKMLSSSTLRGILSHKDSMPSLSHTSPRGLVPLSMALDLYTPAHKLPRCPSIARFNCILYTGHLDSPLSTLTASTYRLPWLRPNRKQPGLDDIIDG